MITKADTETIYAFNCILWDFFSVLPKEDRRHKHKSKLMLTALSEGNAESNIKLSQLAFNTLFEDDLIKWKKSNIDLFQYAMEVIKFEFH